MLWKLTTWIVSTAVLSSALAGLNHESQPMPKPLPLLSSINIPTDTLTEITDFDKNATNAKMFVYVPEKLPAKPAILVGMHWCHGTALEFYNATKYKTVAAKYGFIVIYPQAGSSDGCWDVHSDATLTHGAGGESGAIASMVSYVIQKYAADASRVFVTGVSSGAMMTNVLLGAYPDVFKAGSAFAGVPFGCFDGGTSWNSACAAGLLVYTGAAWAKKVRAAYPTYTGARPRIQIWHGSDDKVLNAVNFAEQIKQWTNVLGVKAKPSSTEKDVFQSGWIRTRYANSSGVVQVEAILETGRGHDLLVMEDEALRFFGFVE
jgi:acetylxylan esterase